MSPFWSKGGQSSMATDHRPYMGIDLWPLDSHTFWLPWYAELYLFWIILVIRTIWAHFRWNRTNLKIWPSLKKVNDLLLIWPLSKNVTSYEFHVIGFLVSYDPRKIWHALQPNWSMLTILVGLPCSFIPPPPVTPAHLTDLCVHPRSVH